ncbi:PadR family transcriptional regulator [Demequina sp. SYSU T00192]|uniref:PadR family transcriptional regulator n=1 Tax=Demequina litoralis TaxID=3051660 RepID=A0ABT8G8V4_9MICO|nr:PadR family transcriptional regulator [Demequina sp. SYSU T00192]MDN4475114.1 PadR family transcriptional regulator [Demequina sp. SYSU T00192]
MTKTDVLTLAILGILRDQPLHGYQIRKRLGAELGPFRALSYGSLYPCLRRMVEAGLIESAGEEPAGASPASSRRARIAYSLTDAGRTRLAEELASAGASSWDDDAFDVRFSLFAHTDAATRLRILEGRRSRLSERLEEVAEGLKRMHERHDAYTAELQRHGLEQVEREISWLDRLIENERSAPGGDNPGPTPTGH